MKHVLVRGADGSERELALVRVDHGVAFVCPLSQVDAVLDGDEDSIVGFPKSDVREANA